MHSKPTGRRRRLVYCLFIVLPRATAYTIVLATFNWQIMCLVCLRALVDRVFIIVIIAIIIIIVIIIIAHIWPNGQASAFLSRADNMLKASAIGSCLGPHRRAERV